MQFYVSTLFLLHGLSPLPGVSFGFVVAACALLVAIFRPKMWRQAFRFRLDDGLFALIFLLGLIPLLLHPSSVGAQNLLYALQWLIIWFVSFWWIREWLLTSTLSYSSISAAAALGCTLLSLAVLAEFALANTAGLYLSDFVPFSVRQFPPATVFGATLQRPRGFAAEAGFTAITFECLIPISFAWLSEGSARKWLFPVIVMPAYLLLFSGASLTFLVLALLVYTAVFHATRRAALAWLFFGGAFAAAALFSNLFAFVLHEIVIRKFLEFSPDDIAIGAESFSRPEAYALALKIFQERPLGIGWGGVSQQFASGLSLLGVDLKGSGLISVPLEIGACAGVLGMLIYVLIVVRKLRRLQADRSLMARLTFFSLLWVSLHHTVVLEFWFPLLWFSMALADTVALQNRPVVSRATIGRRLAGELSTPAPEIP